jgi:hypothetical protein
MKLTKSQNKTLDVIASCGGWVTNSQLRRGGAWAASCQKLVELGLIEERGGGNEGFKEWKAMTKTDREIKLDYAKINPWHQHLESLNENSCRFVTGAQVLASLAMTIGEKNDCSSMDMLMEAINYIVKQDTCGQPLSEMQANEKMACLIEILQEGCIVVQKH